MKLREENFQKIEKKIFSDEKISRKMELSEIVKIWEDDPDSIENDNDDDDEKKKNSNEKEYISRLKRSAMKNYDLNKQTAELLVDFYFDQEKKKLELLDFQKTHAMNLLKKLENSYVAIDLSLMGCGKTYLACYIAEFLKMRIFVICPSSVESSWWKMKAVHGAPIYKVITYETLRSRIGCKPKFNILERNDEKDSEGKNITSFEATEEFKSVMENYRILIVFDEIQKAKNNTDQYKACLAITKVLMRSPKCRGLMLSGTPIDKKEQSINMMRLLRIVRHPQLSRLKDGVLTLLGAKELRDSCAKIDEKLTGQIINEKPFKESVAETCYELFIRVILPNISSKMVKPEHDSKLNIYNKYFMCPENERKVIKSLVHEFNSTCFFKDSKNELTRKDDKDCLGIIQKMLQALENAKVGIFIRTTLEKLKNDNNTKVVVMMKFKKPIRLISEALSEYKPIVITGDVEKTMRKEMISPFMENNSKSRVLIGNFQVLSTGIDLDDKDGNFPRYVLASPNYETMLIQQMCYRFLRGSGENGTKSDTTIHFVYAKCTEVNDVKEVSILKALSAKSRVMKDGCLEEKESIVKYPDEYPEIVDC